MTFPKVKYLVPSHHGFVLADDTMCELPMRLARDKTCQTTPPAITYGQYFRGITDVVSKDGYRLLVDATAKQRTAGVSLADIEEVLIYVEKHGSDYHPARIEVTLDDQTCAAFVMNVAVTARGKARLCSEFEVLQYLNRKYDFPFLPRTYFQGEAVLPTMVMFLADWFQGYHEFHLSMDKDEGSPRLAIWDTHQRHRFMTPSQAWEIYRCAAMIMTLYYDVHTFEQIFPWHHAAGDFVVKERARSVEVRLVTARQYSSMMEPSQGVLPHEALLFFLLNLSLRMRLDRLDGVGAVAWAGDECVRATLEGFVDGLRMKEGEGFTAEFVQYMDSLSKEDLSERFHALVGACDQSAPDVPVIRQHLQMHISTFHVALQGMNDA